ncbi:MAG: diguanylate cyclase [Zoogloeaceae bacterium]|jgi:diguanylate cyclase (GGDEF)-like protein|nr:diguanylate cyclase [Zoogloeaceae bacterium]
MTKSSIPAQSTLHILLVEDNPGDIRLLQEIMRETSVNLTLEYVRTLQGSFPLLEEKFFDAILLDLSLPDSSGLSTVTRVRERAPDYPIVVLTGSNDEETALNAVREGAQDCLVKGRIDGPSLLRVIRYAIERNRVWKAMRSLSLIDDLTGLYNLNGFMTLGAHHIQLSRRRLVGFHLLFIDIDGLRRLDAMDYRLGNQRLVAVARLLSNTFRGSDVVARVGGDEFAVITSEAEDYSAPIIQERLLAAIDHYNRDNSNNPRDPGDPDLPPLSISYGLVFFEASARVSLEHLLAEARKIAEEQKRGKEQGRN